MYIYVYKYIIIEYTYIIVYRCVRQWLGRLGFNLWSSHSKDSKKWYLMLLCLTLNIIRYQ